jgi:hypothetical protein
MKLWKLGATALLLAGCGAVTTTYAVYKHPVNGDSMECEVLHSGGVVNNVPRLFSGDAYAQCKNTLEERGYVRQGTTHHERNATTPAEAAVPRPAPTATTTTTK